jgi:GrpB-like predicted nucleotidyltransferase (UPF0157 family)
MADNVIGLARGVVKVVSYSPEWPRCFEEEAARLREALGERIIEHVGSTSIEGMDAKPIIDLLVAVENLQEAEDFCPVLEQMGYERRPNGDLPGRVYYAKGPQDFRTHHLSFSVPGSDFWRDHVAFRDHLRAHPQAAEAYRKIKHDLAQQFRHDRAAYTEGKAVFITRILRQG